MEVSNREQKVIAFQVRLERRNEYECECESESVRVGMHPEAMTGTVDEGRDLLPAATSSLPLQAGKGRGGNGTGGSGGSATREAEEPHKHQNLQNKCHRKK